MSELDVIVGHVGEDVYAAEKKAGMNLPALLAARASVIRPVVEARMNAERALRAKVESCDAEMRMIEERSRGQFQHTLIIAGFGLACVLLLALL